MKTCNVVILYIRTTENKTIHGISFYISIVKTVVVLENYCGTCSSTVAPECLNLCLSECHIKHNCLFKVKKFMGKFVVKILTYSSPIMESGQVRALKTAICFQNDSTMGACTNESMHHAPLITDVSKSFTNII